MGLFDRLRGKDHPRVAFIGIDGVPFTLLSEHPDEFPNFAALADEGDIVAVVGFEHLDAVADGLEAELCRDEKRSRT